MKCTVIILIAFLFFANAHAQLGPVQPSKDTTPQSQVKDITNLQLPYKPLDPETIPNLDVPSTLLPETVSVTLDWTKIPFIPFKTPELPPAPDPVI